MPSLSTDFYSVDTIQVHGADQAFLSGSLGLGQSSTGDMATAIPLWSDSMINCALTTAVILFAIVILSRLIEILPMLFAGIWRTKPVMNIENNVRLSSQRNLVAIGAFAAMSLILARYDIISLRVLERFSAGVSTLLVIAIIIVVLLFRGILIAWFRPHGRGTEYYKASNTLMYNFTILCTLFLCITVGGCMCLGVNEMIVRKILIYEMAFFWVLFALRKIEISSNYCNLFIGFLYLCALEILPLGLLVAASMIF